MAIMYRCDACGKDFVGKDTGDGWVGGTPHLTAPVESKEEDGIHFRFKMMDLCMGCIAKMARSLRPGNVVVSCEQVKQIRAPRKKKENTGDPADK